MNQQPLGEPLPTIEQNMTSIRDATVEDGPMVGDEDAVYFTAAILRAVEQYYGMHMARHIEKTAYIDEDPIIFAGPNVSVQVYHPDGETLFQVNVVKISD